ncbi:hypothetical protein BDW75DRAFT_163208 [Aspergillus navahoensis]
MSIHFLPPKILLMVAGNLEPAKDIDAFSQVSSHFYPIASDILYRYKGKQKQLLCIILGRQERFAWRGLLQADQWPVS